MADVTEADAHLAFFDCMSKSQKKRNTPVIKLDEDTPEIRLREKLIEVQETINDDNDDHDEDNADNHSINSNEKQDRFEYDYINDFNSMLNNMNFKEKEDVNEKKEILYHLMRDYGKENQGQWSLETPIHELKYELKKRKNAESEQDNIEFIKQIIVVVLHVIEFANKKIKILNLDGWASHVTLNLEKYHRSLKAIHLRYFRNRINDPITELGWMIIGSMVIFHISNGKPASTGNANDTSRSGNQPSGGLDIGSVLNLLGKLG